MKSIEEAKHILILNDIRSAQNVGSLFRTADAVGIDFIYLSAITAQPIDRFGREVSAIAKTALGAEKIIPWKSYQNIFELLEELKKRQVYTIAIEQDKKAVDYKKNINKKAMAFILGNEVTGLSGQILKQVDCIASIPVKGQKESLNVAVAGGIALYRILNV